MNIKTKEDIYSFNKHKNNESLNKDTSNNIYDSLKTILYNTNVINVDKILSNKKNLEKIKFRSPKNVYYQKYFSNSIKKKSLILNPNLITETITNINPISENTKNEKKIEFKRVISPFDRIKFLNIKNLKIKNNILPLINNNIKNEILKNKSSFLKVDLKGKFNSLKNIFKKKLKLTRNFSDYKINFFNDYEKDFFPGIDYSNLEYNEHEIYKDKTVYDNLIKDKINYFRNNINENKTIKLEKIFHYGKSQKEIKLTLESLKITLEDMSKVPGIHNNILKIDLPFALLPIFYYKGSDSFQKLLAAVVKVGQNFESIFFDDNKIGIALNYITDYQTSSKKESDEDDDFNFDLSIYQYLSYKNKAKKTDDKPISLRPLILQKSKNFLRFNNFIFFWITNSRNFVTKITLPCITVKILDTNVTIRHFLDYEFLFFLYKRNFLNWEYYIIRNLSNYSKFRFIFAKLDSIKKICNKTIFLKEPKTKINTFEEETLFNIYTDQFYVNHIILFKSFYVIVGFIDSNYIYEKKYHIYFSFTQYIKLYEISSYSSKIEFLIKFLEINNETHTLNFNFKEYDSFDINIWMNNIKKFSEKSLVKRNNVEEELSAELDIHKNKLFIEFKKPQWTIIKFENNKEISKTWEIGKELEIDLVKSIQFGNTENWTNLLNNCLKK